MRAGSVTQWLRAAKQAPAYCKTAQRYATGITLCQIGWTALLFTPLPSAGVVSAFALMVMLELAVPAWAEKAGSTPWHPHHIAERFGLMTIIVLGESILSSSMALQNAIALHAVSGSLILLAISAIIMLFSMWWLYFHHTNLNHFNSVKLTFSWSYGHYIVFASAAAVGAGLAASVDYLSHQAHISPFSSGMAVALPTALYLFGLWFCHELNTPNKRCNRPLFPVFGIAILLTPFTPYAIPLCAFLLVILLCIRLHLDPPSPAHTQTKP